jgi:putative PIN family toxin of toxin-antitoxin system
MKIFIDTNILISAARSAAGTPYLAFVKATTAPNRGVICEQNLAELRRVFNRKFPDKIALLEQFLALALPVLEVIPVPPICQHDETKIRDVSDRPLLRAAMAVNADILITGDKDFLEADIKTLPIVTAAEFIKMDQRHDG